MFSSQDVRYWRFVFSSTDGVVFASLTRATVDTKIREAIELRLGALCPALSCLWQINIAAPEGGSSTLLVTCENARVRSDLGRSLICQPLSAKSVWCIGDLSHKSSQIFSGLRVGHFLFCATCENWQVLENKKLLTCSVCEISLCDTSSFGMRPGSCYTLDV